MFEETPDRDPVYRWIPFVVAAAGLTILLVLALVRLLGGDDPAAITTTTTTTTSTTEPPADGVTTTTATTTPTTPGEEARDLALAGPLPVAPIGGAALGAVWTGRDLVGVASQENAVAVAAFDGQAWRELPEPPGTLTGGTVTWSGTELYVISGTGDGVTGAAWSPEAASWRQLDSGPIPLSFGYSAVWTDREVIVWGGYNSASGLVNRGAAYDPETDSWRQLPRAPLEGRRDATMVWTGEELIVWGGGKNTPGAFRDGAAYDPATDGWRLLPDAGLAGRDGHTAVWTGEVMLVWGGTDGEARFADGAAYDPETDAWRPLPALPDAAVGRSGHTAAWADGHMIIWGGAVGAGTFPADGWVYSPAAEEWQGYGAFPSIEGRADAVAAWTGEEVWLWGGFNPGGQTAGGAMLSLVAVSGDGPFESGEPLAYAPLCSISPPPDEAGTTRVTAFFGCFDLEPTEVRPVERLVPETRGVLRASLLQLLQGPTAAERSAGFSSGFSEDTAGLLNTVTLSAGEAVVDFPAALQGAPSLAGVGTSTGSTAFLSELFATVFQFSTVDSVVFQLDGDCDAFWAWHESECTTITREAIEATP